MDKESIEREAINIVQSEKSDWEDATAFITERVAFQMRNLIRTLRKNYWGIFDKPKDPLTGRKKIWYPLTEELCNAVQRNIDLDTKDINIRAKNTKGYATVGILRPILRDFLNKNYFGEILDESELQAAIDGTVVWKTYEAFEKGEKKIKTKIVDLLNFWIDPTADNIQSTPAVIERSVMTLNELKSYDWRNVDIVEGRTDIGKNDPNMMGTVPAEGDVPLVEVFERWGLVPKYLITGDKKDKEMVEGRIVASNVDNAPVIHKIEENSTGVKPYEEFRLLKIPGRWYGKGIAERVMMLQLWMNTIINIRINRSYVSQLGLFKIRKGSGVTPQMLSKLGSNGAVVLNDLNDLEQMVMQEASQSSYTDENNIRDIASRLTSAFEVVTGEGLPSSTPATNVVIQDRNARSAFTMIKEGLGMFIQRYADRHLLPKLIKNIKKDELVRIVGDDDKIKEYVDRIVITEAEKKLGIIEENLKQGIPQAVPTFDEIQKEIDSARQRLLNRGELFMKLTEKLVNGNYDTQVYVTNEEMDVAVTIQNLMSLLPVFPERKEAIGRQVMDLMGLDLPPQTERPQEMGEAGQPSLPEEERGLSPRFQQLASEQGITTEANVQR